MVLLGTAPASEFSDKYITGRSHTAHIVGYNGCYCWMVTDGNKFPAFCPEHQTPPLFIHELTQECFEHFMENTIAMKKKPKFKKKKAR